MLEPINLSLPKRILYTLIPYSCYSYSVPYGEEELLKRLQVLTTVLRPLATVEGTQYMFLVKEVKGENKVVFRPGPGRTGSDGTASYIGKYWSTDKGTEFELKVKPDIWFYLINGFLFSFYWFVVRKDPFDIRGYLIAFLILYLIGYLPIYSFVKRLKRNIENVLDDSDE
jgi:hypothetical protein